MKIFSKVLSVLMTFFALSALVTVARADNRIRSEQAASKNSVFKANKKPEMFKQRDFLPTEPLRILPRVVSVNPPNNITAGVEEPITITFSKKMDPASLDKESLSLTGYLLFSSELEFEVVPADGSGMKFTIVPREPLVPKVAYIVTLHKDGPKDLDGTGLADDYKWTFFTDEHPCLEPELTITVTKASCLYHPADACDKADIFEGSCDPGWNDGDPIIDASDYIISYTTKNVTFVEDGIPNSIGGRHYYAKDTNFDGDSGDIEFTWDKLVFASLAHGQEKHWVPIPGTQHSTVTAHGACGKTVTRDYYYNCP